MTDFEPAVEYVLNNEKGFIDNPNDAGGATHFGISMRFLKNLSPDLRKKYSIYDPEITTDLIKNLTIDQAQSIYKGEFWDHAPFDRIMRQAHANYIFDMAVNMGISPAIKCVQRACWSVMKKWELLVDDGILGEQTLSMINQSGIFLLPPIRAERGNYYLKLVEKEPNNKEFLDGWYNRTYNTP